MRLILSCNCATAPYALFNMLSKLHRLHRITVAVSARSARRVYAAQAAALALGETDANPTALLMHALREEERRLRKICAERGLDYDELARQYMPHLGPVKRGTRLREILGITDDPLPRKRADAPGWAGADAGEYFAPDVDEIDGREFDSE